MAMGRLHLSSVRGSLLVLVLLAGLPGLGFTAYTGVEQRRAAAARVQAEAMQLARLSAAEEQRLLDETRVLLIDLARQPEVRLAHGPACSAALREVSGFYPRYANLGVADRFGNVVCSALPVTQPVNIADRAYFRLAIQNGRFSIGEYQIGRITGRASVNAGYPIYDGTARLTGVVFAALGLNWLNQMAVEVRLPPGSTINVVDAGGTILARHPDPERWVGRSLPDVPGIKAILKRGGEGTTEAVGVDGVRRLYAFAPLGRAPQAGRPFVSIGIPAAVAYADITRLLMLNLAGMALAILLAVVAAWWGGDRLLLRRLRALVEAANRLGGGDLRVRTGLHDDRGELGQVARAFDDMAGALQRREEEARAAEVARRGSEERLRLLMGQLPAVIWTTDLELRFTSSQGAGLTGLGLRPGQVVGMTLQEFFRSDDPAFPPIVAHRAALQGESRTYELEWDGGTYQSHVEPLRDAAGRTIGVLGIALDVTERKRAQEQTRQAELRYRTLFEEMPIGLYRTTPGGQIVDVNPALIQMLGYPDRETYLAIGAKGLYVDPQEREAWKAQMEREGVVRGVEFHFHRYDGSTLWVEDNARAVRDATGAVLYYEGSIQDITARKQAAEALRESEERFRRLAENAPDLIFRYRLAPTPGFEYVSPAAAAITGYTPEEHYADPELGLKLVLPEDRALLEEATRNPAACDNRPLRLRWRRKDGTVLWIEQRLVPVHHDGRLIAIEGIARDITDLMEAGEAIRALNAQLERRVAERTAELREAKGFLEHLIATSPGVLFQATSEDFTATYVSPNLERLLGYRSEEVVGVPYFLLERMHPEDRARALAAQNQRRLHGSHAELAGRETEVVQEIRFRHRDGSYRWFSVAMRISHDTQGIPAMTLGHALDITERKRAEEAMLEARAEAERANLAKSEFLSRMSHELRTPLHSVLGFAQLLEMDAQRPEQAESVQQILRAGRHLLDLINEVLDISRIEAGRVSVSPEPVHVGELVRESLDLIAPMAAAKRLQLHGQTAGASDRYVRADRQRLKQVLLNLLSNAVKYNRPEGTVVVALSEPAPGRLRFLVSDTGPGIPADRLERLFKPFERLHTEESGVEGIGLGLALSKRLVEAMGGVIGVETTVGTGSTFWVDLPLMRSPLEAAGTMPDRAGDASRAERTVLYIEDNLANVRLVERILARRPGLRLLSAMQGRLGLDLMREHRPDLVLLDINLSDLQGDEVLRLMREDARTREIPVVVLTGTEDRRVLKRLLAAGARAYLTKPLDAQRLLALVEEILPVPVGGEQRS